MKYKIGDKVVLRKDLSLDKMYGELALLKGVRDALLKEDYVEIISIVRNKYYGINIGYVVSEEMIEGLLKPKTTKYDLIITSTNKVIILDKENGTKGMATCHPDDEFDIVKGFDLAWSRLKGIEPHKSREDIINEEYGVNDEFKPSNKKPILNDDYNKEMGKVRNLVGLTEDKVNATRQEYINRMSGFPNTIIEEPKFKDSNKLSDVEKRLFAKQLADELLKKLRLK